MSKNRKKVLIETSVVGALLGNEPKEYCEFVADKLKDDRRYTSTYVRKEFTQHFIVACLNFAIKVHLCDSISEAMRYASHEFHSRRLKAYLKILASFVDSPDHSQGGAEISIEFIRLAVRLLERFDAELGSKINNSSKCKIGDKRLEVDYNCYLEDVRDFLASIGNQTNCKVTQLFKKHFPKIDKHFKGGDIPKPIDRLITEARKIDSTGASIDCNSCQKIGDLIIAFEQPPSYTLITLDKSFEHLCQLAGNHQERLTSVTAFGKTNSAEKSS